MQSHVLNSREPIDRERLTTEWLEYAVSGAENRFWAYEALYDLIDDDPCLAFEIILDLLHRAPTESTFGHVAAGPLEDLVAWRGREVISHIEQRAQDDEDLRRALSGLCVGPATLDPETLERCRNLGVKRIG
jgi:hypothetical protein